MGSGACHAVLSSPTWGHERKRSSATRDGRAAFRRFSRCGFHPQQRQRAASRPCRRRRQRRIAFQPDDRVGGLRGAESRRAPRSEEHTSELQSLMRISYAVFCLKKKKKTHTKSDTI